MFTKVTHIKNLNLVGNVKALENTHTHKVEITRNLTKLALKKIGTWAIHEISKLEKCTHGGLNYHEPLKKMKLELDMKYQTFCEPWKPKPC